MTPGLNLETYTTFHGFRFDGVELFPIKMKWYRCPECDGGPVTNHGGGLYICSDCRYQI